MYGFRSFRRRHVLLILVATILLIFVTSNTHAVHHLRRLDIESIDWTNYEDDIISHVKEELNSIVEDPESFLKSKDNLEKSTKVESTKVNELTSSTSEASSTSTKTTASTTKNSEPVTKKSIPVSSKKEVPKEALEKAKEAPGKLHEETQEASKEVPENSEKEASEREKLSSKETLEIEENKIKEKALEKKTKELQKAKSNAIVSAKPKKPVWVYPEIPAPGEKAPKVIATRFVVKKFLNASSVHIFYRSKPEAVEQRRLVRAYMKMWMSIDEDSMLPMDYSIVTFEDEKTKLEQREFGDLVLCQKNSSELEEYTSLMHAVEYAAEVELSERAVAIFAYTTDLVDSSEIRTATGKLAAIDSEGQKNIICFKQINRDTNHYASCGEQPVFAIRGDVAPLLAKEMQIIRPFMGSIEEHRIGWLTGLVRVRSRIEGICVNQDNHNLIQMPFELEAFKDFYDDVYDWGMDRRPRELMDYDLPDIYRQDEKWQIELEKTPACDPSPYLYLVKTSRPNFKRRNFLRAFQAFDRNSTKLENHPQMRFLLGKGQKTEAADVSKAILEEMEEHGDIVLGNFVDSYDNLPHKTMTGYTYFAKQCHRADKKQYVMFIDDDVLMDVQNLDGYFKSENASDFACFGFLGEHARPNRWGKYNVTIEQWAGGHFFPKFCSGPCAGMSSEMAEKIFDAASTTDAKGFKLEDVLFTGVIRTKAGIAEPAFKKDICKHFDMKTKQSTELAMWQHIRQLSNRRKFMTSIQDQEKLARLFGLDPNEVVHHRIGSAPSSVFKNSKSALSQVRPVVLAGKIGEKAQVFGRPALPGVFQAPNLAENLIKEENETKQLSAKEVPKVTAIPYKRENPFVGRNVRIAGKSRN